MSDRETDSHTTPFSPCGCLGGSCSIYEKPWVQEFLGESFHPGGIELTQRSIDSLKLSPGSRVLDLASGTGASAVALASSGYRVMGIDASKQQVERARKTAGESDKIEFRQATAENLPADLGTFDALFCECAFSLMQDQSTISKRWLQLLRSGGRIAISDMVVNGSLPASLCGDLGDWACLGGAQSESVYRNLFETAGFVEVEFFDEREAMLESIAQLKRKLLVYGVGHLSDIVQDIGTSLPQLIAALKDAKTAVESGVLSYGRLSATKP